MESIQVQLEQQLPLSTAQFASCFYPALGEADGRNEVGKLNQAYLTL